MIETKLNNLEINELTEEQYNSAKESGNLSSNAFYMTPSAENVSDAIPVIKGGTGATIAADARTNLGFEYGSEAPTHVPETGDGAVYFKIDDEDDGVTPIEHGGTGAVTVEGIHANLGQADYVVKEDTDGIWTYRKWNSGIAECWGNETVSVAISSTWGTLYYGEAPARAFPSNLFTEITVINKDVKALGGWSCFLGCYTTGDYSTANTGATALLRPNSASASSFKIAYYAKGRWK